MFDNRARSSGSQFIPRDPAAPLILEADPAGITYELAIYRQLFCGLAASIHAGKMYRSSQVLHAKPVRQLLQTM
jgi:hypothetical protein